MIETRNRQITADADECIVLVADTPELLSEVFRLRYQVYCVEKGYEPGYDGIRAVQCSQLKHQLARALNPARAAAYLS